MKTHLRDVSELIDIKRGPCRLPTIGVAPFTPKKVRSGNTAPLRVTAYLGTHFVR